MTINIDTFVTDLRALTPEEFERVQLYVNGEYAARIQEQKLAARLEHSVAEAQAAGFTDAEIEEVFSKAQNDFHTKRDPDYKPGPPSNPQANLKSDLQVGNGLGPVKRPKMMGPRPQ